MTLGAFGQEEEIISNPLSPSAIKDIIYNKCNLQDEREAVLQQELVIHIGWIISNSPELFNGMLKIRVGLVNHSLKLVLVMSVDPFTPRAQIEMPGQRVSPEMARENFWSLSRFYHQVLNINRNSWRKFNISSRVMVQSCDSSEFKKLSLSAGKLKAEVQDLRAVRWGEFPSLLQLPPTYQFESSSSST